ncbi:MAG: SH3 domain-containing protein [Rhizobiaceae bacterium]
MTKSARVLSTYTACYADPIAVDQGEAIELSGRTDNWQGHSWLWARASDGREGWVPDSLVEDAGIESAVALFDYSAMELSCKKNEVLAVVKNTHGWTWCVNSAGDEGWVPDQNLRIQ